MAATVSLIQMLATGCLTSAGAPIASGKARFYLPGTLTPVSVYSDSAGATAITPPLTLTAGGTGVAYTKVPTRLILKDSTETTTYFDGLVNIHRAEQLEIQSASVNGGTETTLQALLDAIGTSFGGTAGLWKFKAGTGGTERNFVDVINDFGISVKSFGATGGGAVDDYTAIQNTINFIVSLGGGVVYFPPGTYLSSATLSLSDATALVTLKGAHRAVSKLKNTSATASAITASGNTQFAVRDMIITNSGTSTGKGIDATTGGFCLLDFVGIDSHATGAKLGVLGGSVSQSVMTTSAASTAAALITAGTAVVIGGTYTSAAGIGIQVSAGQASIYGGAVAPGAGGIAGVDVAASSSLYAHGVVNTGALTLGLRTAATSATIYHAGCDWQAVTDGRTGAPVRYTFAADGNFTPLPLQTDTIRVDVTAAAVVTINAAAAIGFGRKFSLMLCRSTAGAVTWTFNAQYVLQGGAAPAPTNGNMMISIFEYDPISSKYRETSRSASMAI